SIASPSASRRPSIQPSQRNTSTARDQAGLMPRTAAGRERLRTIVYSLVLLAIFLGAWQALAGAGGKGGKAAGIPGPAAVAETAWHMLSDPFYARGPNDKGFG